MNADQDDGLLKRPRAGMRSRTAVVLDRGRIVADMKPRDMTVPELTEYLIGLQAHAV